MNLHRAVCKCWLIAALILVMIQAPLLTAQIESGKVVGSVRDATGAVLAGARITVTNVETNASRSVVTNESGEYVATELQPGTYTLVTERQGFKKAVQTPFRLNVNQVVRVDVTLAVGSVNETMTVTEAEPLVDTDTSSTGQVIEENRVHELPINGRNFMQLAYLSPGVNAGPTGTVQSGNIPENERDNGSIQVNGMTATNNNYLLNGFDNNEQQIGFELIEPPIDAIEEFKVQTSNMTADIGKGGAVVNVVLKSGTNQFHGSAFEFLRNSWMDAKNYFDDATLPIPPFKRNEFGATFGGPILKNKSFFFVDYQGRRIHQALTDLSIVPTLPISTNLPTTVVDPRNGNTLTAAQLDPANANTSAGLPICPNPAHTGSCLDPAAVNVIALFPAPNANHNGFNYLSNPVTRVNQDSFDIKVDQQMSSDAFLRCSATEMSTHIGPTHSLGLQEAGSSREILITKR